MIKDRIIELENGINYYILEDISYMQKKYVLAAECDLEHDSVKEDRYLVMEVKINNNDLYIVNIEDDETSKMVTKLLLEKIRN